jgi:hypothetical protein
VNRGIARVLAVLTGICIVLVAGLAAYFAATSPLAFQKSATIEVAEPALMSLHTRGGRFDVASLMERIRYKRGEMVYAVRPSDKHASTILGGVGNCSNFSFGLAYELRQTDHDYQIVHLLSPESIVDGDAHTVINTTFQLHGQTYNALIDLAMGGVPYSHDQPLTLDNLRAGELPTAIVRPNARRKSNVARYASLRDIAVLTSADVNRYFDFIEAIYVPLGHEKLEKIVFDALAVTFGFYPKQYVTAESYTSLFRNNRGVLAAALTLLWSMRVLLALLALCLVTWLVLLGRRRSKV